MSAQQRYVQASPPYNLGDGDVPLFVFVVVNSLGKIESTYVAQDPPWANNGPTNIQPDFIDLQGRKFRKTRNPLQDLKQRLQSPDLKIKIAALEEFRTLQLEQ